jgi:hypothetical protein
MTKKNIMIEKIPSILWGEYSDKLFIAIHGNMSNKEDEVIVIFSEEAVSKGYQVLSFDLPEHGDRKNEEYLCKVFNCVNDLNVIMNYAKTISKDISIFGCSMGTYFSLLAYSDFQISKCLFLSPVLNMERIINNMMTWFNISEERLENEKEIATPIGQTLYWDYYCYVKAHPVNFWDKPTSILYGANDNLVESDLIFNFAKQYNCKLEILENGEHFFHTESQLQFYRQWLKVNII